MGGGEEHNGMVTKAISACSCFIRAEGNWKARSSAIPWGEDPEMRRRKALSRRKIHSREKGGGGGGGYVSVTWRLAIGYSGYPLETRPTLFSADGNFWKSNFADLHFWPNLGAGEALAEVREKGVRRFENLTESSGIRNVNERRQIN